MSRKTLQYALDRTNYGRIDETLSFDQPIQLGHLTGKVHIVCKKDVDCLQTYAVGRHMFEYNYLPSYTHDPPEIYFDGIKVKNQGSGGIFKVRQPNTAPAKLYIDNCLFFGGNTYAIDARDSGPMEGIVIQNTQFNTAHVMRWHFRGRDQNNYIQMDRVRKQGGGRFGPSINLKNATNVSMELMIDENSWALRSDYVGVYEGPLAIRITNPVRRCVIDDVWCEPPGTTGTESPNCWGVEVRVDDTSANYGQHMAHIYNISLSGGAITPGEKLVHIQGGHSNSNAASLAVWMYDVWNNNPHNGIQISGKLRYVHNRQYVDGDINETLPTAINAVVAGSWRDAISTGFAVLPRQDNVAGTNWNGTDYKDNFTANIADAV